MPFETEQIDKLYLELSQFTRATTAKELKLQAEIRELKARIATFECNLEREPHDLLPPVGAKVYIHLASSDLWVEHTVVGYYVWGALDGLTDSYHRVFVRVVDDEGVPNARLLKDIRWEQ